MNAPKPGRRSLFVLAAALLLVAAVTTQCSKLQSSAHRPYRASVAQAEIARETYEIEVEEKEEPNDPASVSQACEQRGTDGANKGVPRAQAAAERPFVAASNDPKSTVSIDVDTASYSLVRNYLLRAKTAPPTDVVRIEELLNYFDYGVEGPRDAAPLAVHTEVSPAPWAPGHDVVRIAIQGRRVEADSLPPANLVFLLDVSGSMNHPTKLPLLRASMNTLTKRLRPQDRVAIVVYAGAAGLVLPSTPGSQRGKILAALERLEAGGSTAGAAGLKLAYKVARDNFIERGTNRVIIATDGDFNVGPSSREALVKLISKQRKSNVFLSVLGFGMGNYRDGAMQELADRGNGNHAYIDTITEAHKVLARQLGSTLFTIAKDVKVQVRFDPKQVKRWRLIGYDNRVLAHRDFNDDTKDAGELGAGHAVTYLYEIERRGDSETDDLLKVRLRYKEPTASVSRLIEKPAWTVSSGARSGSNAMQWALAVAEAGLVWRDSKYKGAASLAGAQRRAQAALGSDPHGDRAGFVQMLVAAQR